jgi:UDP-N-acetyl-D-glucosamine/UDP-N-acetyl-D-galactosamine dehydrogenase
VAVSHSAYRALSIEQLTSLMKNNPVLIDVKGIYDRASAQAAGIRVWRL